MSTSSTPENTLPPTERPACAVWAQRVRVGAVLASGATRASAQRWAGRCRPVRWPLVCWREKVGGQPHERTPGSMCHVLCFRGLSGGAGWDPCSRWTHRLWQPSGDACLGPSVLLLSAETTLCTSMAFGQHTERTHRRREAKFGDLEVPAGLGGMLARAWPWPGGGGHVVEKPPAEVPEARDPQTRAAQRRSRSPGGRRHAPSQSQVCRCRFGGRR